MSATLQTDHWNGQVIDRENAPRMHQFMLRNREHLAPWIPVPDDLGELDARIGELETEVREGTALRLMLTDAADPEGPALGYIMFTRMRDEGGRTCMISGGIDCELQGRGLMSEAMGGAFEMLSSLGFERVEARVAPENERSIALVERMGFALVRRDEEGLWFERRTH